MFKIRKFKFNKYFIILKEEDLKIAEITCENDYKASNEQLSKFSQRHNLIYKNLSGESASVSDETVSNLIIHSFPDITKEYKGFNLDETGLFLPDKIFDV